MSADPTIVSLCFEGTKGAGKTTTIRAVREHLLERGWIVEVVEVFARANEHARELGYAGAVPMYADPDGHRAIVEFEAATRDAGAPALRARLERERGRRGVLVFDRGWITFHTHVFAGACEDAAWREAHWRRALATAPPTLFIHTRPEETMRRRAGQLDAVSGLADAERVRADWKVRLEMVAAHPELVLASIETFPDAMADKVTPALEHIYGSAGFEPTEARARATTPQRDSPNAQHWLDDVDSLAAPLDRLGLRDAVVVEVGVGRGAVTEPILARGPRRLIGIEIDPDVVPASLRERVELHVGDLSDVDVEALLGGERDAAFVAAPPYDRLDVVRAWIDAWFPRALVLVPEHAEADFVGFERAARLDGDAFSPAARGGHCWLIKGAR